MDQDKAASKAGSAQPTSVDEDAIPFNIQDYLTKHDVSVKEYISYTFEILLLCSR